MRYEFSNIQVIGDKLIIPLKELELLSNMDTLNKLKDSIKRKKKTPVKNISERIKNLREEMEDLEDIIEAEAARNEPTTPWEEVKAEMDKKFGITD